MKVVDGFRELGVLHGGEEERERKEETMEGNNITGYFPFGE